MGDDGNFPVKITGDASSLVTASQKAAQGLEATAKAAGKAADDTQRYQKALEAMAVRQSEGKTKGVSSEDQAMIDKAGSRRQELADRKRLSAEADSEIAAGVKNVSQAEVDFATAAVAGTDRVTVKKAELKHAIQGLKEEFPGLAHIAHMALNPITLVVAGVGAAFGILKYRVNDAVKTLAGAVLPDIGPAKVGQVTAMAEAWKTYKEALDGVLKSYTSIEAVVNRSIKAMEDEANRQKKLREAKQALEQANLEAARASMSPAEYQKRSLEGKANAEAAALAAEENTKRKTIEARQKEAQALREDAAKKLATAGGIKVGTAEQDAETEAKYAKAAQEAEEFNKAEQANIDNMLKLKSGEFGFRDIRTKLETRTHVQNVTGRGVFGSQPSEADIDEAIATTRQMMGAGSVTINRSDAFSRNKAAREEARKRRGDLVTEAGTQEGQANVLDQQAAADTAALNTESSTNRRVADIGQAARVASALGKTNDQLKEILDQILHSAEAGNGISADTLRRVRNLEAEQAELKRQQKQEAGSPARTY